MVEIHIKELGVQHKTKLAICPPSGSLRNQLCHLGPVLAGNLLQVGIFFLSLQRLTSERRKPDTFGVSTVLLCNHAIKKVLMTEHYEGFFLLLRLSAR